MFYSLKNAYYRTSTNKFQQFPCRRKNSADSRKHAFDDSTSVCELPLEPVMQTENR